MRPFPAAASRPAAESNGGRTTLVVRLGLVLLALIGIVTIFGEPLLGIGDGSVPAASSGDARATTSAR